MGYIMRQAASIALYENKGIDVVVLDALIDLNFVSFIEYSAGIEGLTFARVDADATTFTQDEPAADEEAKKAQEADQEKLKALFKDATGSETLQIKLQTLTDTDTPALLTQDEQGRRYSDMSKIYGQDFKLPEQHTLVLNRANAVVQALLTEEDNEKRKLIAAQLYDLARMYIGNATLIQRFRHNPSLLAPIRPRLVRDGALPHRGAPTARPFHPPAPQCP